MAASEITKEERAYLQFRQPGCHWKYYATGCKGKKTATWAMASTWDNYQDCMKDAAQMSIDNALFDFRVVYPAIGGRKRLFVVKTYPHRSNYNN